MVPGDRVRLTYTSDPHTHLQPGAEGEFLMTDGAGTVHIKWDDGSHLGLIPGEDRWMELQDKVIIDGNP